jgi:Flp pilus assembly protein TadG
MYAIDLLMIALRASSSAFHRLRAWAAGMRQERGVNSLEMAFIAMIIFVLVAGVVDLGGAYQHYIVVTNASREGARLYARLPCTSATRTTIRDSVKQLAINEPKSSTNIIGGGSGIVLLASNVSLSPDPVSNGCPANSQEVSVTVLDNYEPLMGQFWGGVTFPIRARTRMMYYGVD